MMGSRYVRLLCYGWLLQLVIGQVADAATGRTPGTFGVSATGAATYQIPIWVPPGPKGIQPNLALTYNSQSGDGSLGPGWSLSGLSAITRCNKTYAQDGAPAAVALALSDGYCLNGNRLRLTSGTYGVAGSTYQTEIADFSLITANGSAGNGPAFFTVQRKDGLILEYGNTADSRIIGASTATASQWLVNKVRDRTGNNLVVTYSTGQTGSTGVGVPATISYTPSSAGATTYNYTVNFSYGLADSLSSEAGYLAGTYVKNTNRLDSVTVKSGATTMRKYSLTYELSPTTSRTRLKEVKECTDDALTNCLLPTAIVYQNTPAGIAPLNTPAVIVNSTSVRIQVVDINGDGRQDIVGREFVAAGQYAQKIWVQLSSGAAFGPRIDIVTNASAYDPVLVDDFDGDGDDDILYAAGGVWYLYRWNGVSAFTASTLNVAVDTARYQRSLGDNYASADVNGDGLPDLLSVQTDGKVYRRLNTSSGGTVSFSTVQTAVLDISTQIPGGWTLSYTELRGNNHSDLAKTTVNHFDFNGDDLEDFTITLAVGNGTPIKFAIVATSGMYSVAAQLTNSEASIPVKYNDDSCTDWYDTNEMKLATCDGSLGTVSVHTGGQHPIDWNGDGLTDFFNVTYYPTYPTVSVMLSTGDESDGSSFVVPGSALTDTPLYFLIDQNGDGLDDLMTFKYIEVGCPDPEAGCIYEVWLYFGLHQGAGTPPDLVSSITDGYGIALSFSYVSITQSNYTKGIGAAYPEKDVQKPKIVLSQVTSADGAGGTYTQIFNYTGAREDTQGRGFLGFQSRTVTDSRANAPVVKTFYKTAFPYTGMVYQQDVYQNNGTTLISHTVNTPALTTLDTTAQNQRYFPYVASSATDKYEVGGTKNGVLITQGSASFTYDNYGNLTNSTSTINDNDSSAPASLTYGRVWTTAIANTISPDTANWCLGLPTQTTVTNSSTSITTITRTTNYTPDYANCRTTQQVVEPASSLYKVTIDLGYDSFGNVNSQTVTGINMAARVTTANWGATGQFPVSVTNALNQTTQAGYDYNKGVQTSQTDPNNLTTSWQYDGFNRKTLETRPDATTTSWSYNDCASVSGGCQNGDPTGASSINKMVVIATSNDTGGTPIRDDWTYFDQLDRSIVTKSKTLSGTYSRVGVQYDVFGHKLRETAPCDAASCSVYWNVYSYDALNRITRLMRQVSASDSTPQTTTIAYQGMTTVITDPQGKQTTKVMDPKGRLRRVQDASGYYQGFYYDAFGSLQGITDQASNSQFYAFYSYGIDAFQTQTVTMDLGTWSYTPNALGEVTSYTDANGSVFTQTFDKLSRPLTKFVSGDGTTTWTWGNSAASHNIGKLQSLTSTVGTTEVYSYDAKARLSQKDIMADGTTYTYNYAYNSTTGLLDTLTFPTSTSSYRLALKYVYTNGVLQQLKDNVAGTIFWKANAMNPLGQVTQETLGNGIVTNRAYDAVTGRLNSIQSGVGGGTGVQNESYLFDKVGNVTQRQNNALGLTESFYYDNVYRLDYSQLNGVTNLDMNYDALGNITSRSDVAGGAAWTYHATKKHAVTQAGSSSYTYTYDANGNAITRNGATVTWNKSNYPTVINGVGTAKTTLSYDANNQRWKQIYVNSGGVTETTLYIGGLMEKKTTNSVSDFRYYINAGNKMVAISSRTTTGANALRYTLEDHQDSVDKITDSAGAVIASENFTAYGARRNASTWSGAPTTTELNTMNSVTRQGYTGQTAMDNLGLIHMNGRVQDPITGRFLSADPYITEPENTQNYNRYSYVYNNPMRYTDPSGFAQYDDMEEVIVYGTPDSVPDRVDSANLDETGPGTNPGSGGGGEEEDTGPDKPKRTTPPPDRKVRQCMAIGGAISHVAGSMTSGAVAGGLSGGLAGALVGGALGTAAGIADAAAEQGSSPNDNWGEVRTGTLTAMVVGGVSAGQGGFTNRSGGIAGGAVSGFMGAAGVPAPIAEAFGGFVGGLGERGSSFSAISKNMLKGFKNGGFAGLAGLAVEMGGNYLTKMYCQ